MALTLSLKQMRYFVAIADAGALSRAAEVLSVAQSALSHHIGEMESMLGVTLLDRGTRGISLTVAGRRLYEHACAILATVEKAELDVRTVANMTSGPMIVGLCYTAIEMVSLPIIQKTRRLWPDIQLTILEGLSGGLIEQVIAGELDYALAYNPPPDRRLRSVPILEENLCLVGVPAIIGKATQPIAFKNIPPGQVLGMSLFHSSRSVINSQPLRDIIRPSIILELGSLNAMRKALAAGLGCSILAQATVWDLLTAGAIHARMIVEPEISRQLNIISLADRPETRASTAILAILRSALANSVKAGEWPARLVSEQVAKAI
jgi:LysR family nitrogen assimilation transcriptional regulator